MVQMVVHVCSVAQDVAGTVELVSSNRREDLDFRLGTRTILGPS